MSNMLLKEKQEEIKRIQAQLDQHDIIHEKLVEDLEQVKHDYTKELIKTHIAIIINNVIYFKEELEKLQGFEKIFNEKGICE